MSNNVTLNQNFVNISHFSKKNTHKQDNNIQSMGVFLFLSI